jgi:hypothetical protein
MSIFDTIGKAAYPLSNKNFLTGASAVAEGWREMGRTPASGKPIIEGLKWLFGNQDYGGNTSIGSYNQNAQTRQTAANNAAASSTDLAPSDYTRVRPWIPNLDVDKIYKQSKAKAAGEANSWYQTQLDSFLGQINYKKQLQGDYYNTATEGLENQLKNLIEGNVTTRGRTLEDTSYNLGQIKENEGDRQTYEAQQFDQARRGIQENLGASGMSTSGLGRQKLASAGFDRKMTETAQAREVADKQRTQEKTLSRTFEDLATSEKRKTEETELGKRQAKISFDDAMNDLAMTEQEKRNSLLETKNSMQANIEQANRIDSFLNYYNKLKNAGQRSEAWNQYGGFF